MKFKSIIYSLGLTLAAACAVQANAQKVELLGFTVGDRASQIKARVNLQGKELTDVTTYSYDMTNGASQTSTSYALVDGKYLAAAPKSIINNTAMDALGHLFESYINTTATDYSRMLVAAGLEIFQRSREVLEGSCEASYVDFKNLMNASTIAGMAISHTSTSIPHGLSYSLTYELGVPHGKAVGYFLSGYLKDARREDRDYVLNGAGFSSLSDFEEFYVKSCGVLAPEQSVIESGIEKLLLNRAKLKNCPYEVTEAVLKRIAMI